MLCCNVFGVLTNNQDFADGFVPFKKVGKARFLLSGLAFMFKVQEECGAVLERIDAKLGSRLQPISAVIAVFANKERKLHEDRDLCRLRILEGDMVLSELRLRKLIRSRNC